jgi:hypothetical protein
MFLNLVLNDVPVCPVYFNGQSGVSVDIFNYYCIYLLLIFSVPSGDL